MERDDYTEYANDEFSVVKNRSEFSDEIINESSDDITIEQFVRRYQGLESTMADTGLSSADIDELVGEYDVNTFTSSDHLTVYDSVNDWFDNESELEGIDWGTNTAAAVLRLVDLNDVFDELSGNFNAITLSNGRIVEIDD